ncbi:MAG TPA: ATP-binding protein [Rudaea sp.]|nr:ATP-binding protein [Rudaea sp.]
MQQVFLNLVKNAIEAVGEEGRIEIRARKTTGGKLENYEAYLSEECTRMLPRSADGEAVYIKITDTGKGIPQETIGKIFDPFFTTKDAGRGSGLGLSMVFGTMKQLGGTVKIYSEQDVGTTVMLFLPRAHDADSRHQRDDALPAAIAGGNERVLMVEDNAQIRAVGADILQSLGYRVTIAENGDDALRHVESGEQFDLLFSDIVMPGRLNGIALARELRVRSPEIPILFTSGFASPAALEGAIAELGAGLISKPYRKADLARLMRSILGERTASPA